MKQSFFQLENVGFFVETFKSRPKIYLAYNFFKRELIFYCVLLYVKHKSLCLHVIPLISIYK